MTKKMKLLLALATMVVGLVVPQIASAGCLASAASVDYFDAAHIYVFGGMGCTTSNIGTYEIRAYVQTDALGIGHYAILPGIPAVKYRKTNPPNGFLYQAEFGAFHCFDIPVAANHWRPKFVVQNLTTGAQNEKVGAISTVRC